MKSGVVFRYAAEDGMGYVQSEDGKVFVFFDHHLPRNVQVGNGDRVFFRVEDGKIESVYYVSNSE